MKTEERSQAGSRATPVSGGLNATFWRRFSLMGAIIFICLLGLVHLLQLGEKARLGVILLPAVVLPPCLILRFDRRPWQFSIRSLLLLTAVYAMLLGLAKASFEDFWLNLYTLEFSLVPLSFVALLAHFMHRGVWRLCFGMLLSIAVLFIIRAFLVEELSHALMLGWHRTSRSPSLVVVEIVGISVAVVVLLGFGRSSRRSRDHRENSEMAERHSSSSQIHS